MTGMTTEGQQAYELLAWANAGPDRVPEAAGKVDALALALIDQSGPYAYRALAEVQDVGTVLARLGSVAPPAPPVGLAGDGGPVAPAAMKPPGLPVPDDPTAISMFTAHRVNTILHQVAHASERMEAARAAAGELRAYHVPHIDEHLGRGLASAHELTANLREHYPAEAAEMEAVKDTLGLAVAVNSRAKTDTFAHLTETVLHELTHASRHAASLLGDPPDGPAWEFDADHCQDHIGGAASHAGKLWVHLNDNYPAEARWLNGIAEITHPPATPQQHAAGTIGDQLDLAALHGHHIAGTPYTMWHGWKLRVPGGGIVRIGETFNDKHPQWLVDHQHEAAMNAETEGRGHIAAAERAVPPDASKRVLTPAQRRQVSAHESALKSARTRAAKKAASAAPGSIAAQTDAPKRTAVDPPPAEPGTVGAKLAAEDPALASLAAPGMSADALKTYIDTQVAIQVARAVGEISAKNAEDLKAATANMHKSQQSLIALIRHQYKKGVDKDDGDLRKHTVANTLFAFAGVGIVAAGVATGMGPIALALVAGLTPLVNVVHDYARNLG